MVKLWTASTLYSSMQEHDKCMQDKCKCRRTNLYACSCMRTDATECSLYALRLHIRNAATLHSFTLHTANDAQYRNMTCVCKLNASVGARTRTHAAVCARMLTYSHARLTVASTGRYGGRRKRVDADVCARMRAAAVVCARMQTYACGCRHGCSLDEPVLRQCRSNGRWGVKVSCIRLHTTATRRM